jgi:hypothetical protein
MKKITITFIGTTLLSAASYATPQATVDILIFNVYFQFSGCQSDCFLMRSNKRFCLSLER